MNGKISVIVPIFNGEAYITQMIESIKNQTYSNYEILLVEDHSVDRSKEILDRVCRDDNRFILLEPKDKMGIAVKGQKYALPYCTGIYHFYMSQDDFLDDDFFEKCIEKLENEDADVVIPNCILFDGITNKHLGNYPLNNNYTAVLDSREAFELSLEWKIHGFTMERMDLFRRIGLEEDYYNSEEYYKRILFLEASKIMFADSNFYYRQNNPNAITKGKKYIHIDVLKTDFLLYRRMYRKTYPNDSCKRQLKRVTDEYFKWWYRSIRYNLWYKQQFYVLRCLLLLLFPVLKEWIFLIKGMEYYDKKDIE